MLVTLFRFTMDNNQENKENAAVVPAAAPGDADPQDANAPGGRGSTYTATEDLMVAKAYIRASEDRVKGSKQKIQLFKAKLAATYHLVKKEQEAFEKQDAERPNHLRIFGNNVEVRQLEPYPNRTGNSIYQHFKSKIQPDVVKFISVKNQVSKSVDCKFKIIKLLTILFL